MRMNTCHEGARVQPQHLDALMPATMVQLQEALHVMTTEELRAGCAAFAYASAGCTDHCFIARAFGGNYAGGREALFNREIMTSILSEIYELRQDLLQRAVLRELAARVTSGAVCAGCAGEFPAEELDECCGRPFCAPCLFVHVEREHGAPAPEHEEQDAPAELFI